MGVNFSEETSENPALSLHSSKVIIRCSLPDDGAMQFGGNLTATKIGDAGASFRRTSFTPIVASRIRASPMPHER
ncbi:MAG: hypothetical protein ACRC2V_07800 [Xenococcaceae cyanobacterium]